jgi:hypothetical protein
MVTDPLAAILASASVCDRQRPGVALLDDFNLNEALQGTNQINQVPNTT